MSQDQRASASDHLRVLCEGDLELVGRLPWSSNGTFLVNCTQGDTELRAVYKPERGERPLWDFPPGIYRREVAAWALSEQLGWSLVPETVVREDAPLGVGSLQRFVEADFEQHYFTLMEDASNHDQLRLVCIFDVVANNADRKSGHCLLTPDGHIWAIDHGLCFHKNPKLRTVIWDFCDEELSEQAANDLERLAAAPSHDLVGLLDRDEIAAIVSRARNLARHGRLPTPDPDRHHYPWPLV